MIDYCEFVLLVSPSAILQEWSALLLIIVDVGITAQSVGEWGWGVEGKQVGSMDEESQVRGCYNITFICTPTNPETV